MYLAIGVNELAGPELVQLVDLGLGPAPPAARVNLMSGT